MIYKEEKEKRIPVDILERQADRLIEKMKRSESAAAEECGVCMQRDEDSSFSFISCANCSQTFCEECIKNYLVKTIQCAHSQCPVCRKNMIE